MGGGGEEGEWRVHPPPNKIILIPVKLEKKIVVSLGNFACTFNIKFSK